MISIITLIADSGDALRQMFTELSKCGEEVSLKIKIDETNILSNKREEPLVTRGKKVEKLNTYLGQIITFKKSKSLKLNSTIPTIPNACEKFRSLKGIFEEKFL